MFWLHIGSLLWRHTLQHNTSSSILAECLLFFLPLAMHKVAILPLYRILSVLSDPFTVLALLLFFPLQVLPSVPNSGKLVTTLHKTHGRESLTIVIG